MTDSSATTSTFAISSVGGGAVVLAGMAVGWATAGSISALVGLGCLLAAMNGYSKAYSP